MHFPDKSLPHVPYLPFGPVRKTVTVEAKFDCGLEFVTVEVFLGL